MDKKLIEELHSLQSQMVIFEQAQEDLNNAQAHLKSVENFQPKRLEEFDNAYLPTFIYERIGAEPATFTPFDPRKLLKKVVEKRNAEIQNYKDQRYKLEQEFYQLYKEKRNEFKRLDDEEKTDKLTQAKNEVEQMELVIAEENLKIESVTLLPKSMLISTVIEKLIGYLENWRAATLKDAINLYFDEEWKHEESEQIQKNFERVIELLSDNQEKNAIILEKIQLANDTISELQSSIDGLNDTIQSQIKN